MSANNQAQDRYNAPGTSEPDFEKFTFSELEENELFWFDTNPDGNVNVVHRKVGNQGLHLKTQTLVNIDRNRKVYQRT